VPPLTIHDLRITLLDVTPPIWRRLRVPSEISLQGLHRVVQVAFGWEDRHLHQWTVGDTVYVDPQEPSWGEPVADESWASLASVAPADASFHYDYDFGDGWEHLVEVLGVLPYEPDEALITCVDGARGGPPEDCGGPGGYERILDALRDPEDPEHDEMVEAYGDVLDPEGFDRTAINARLADLMGE
jgi:hypothetical protein